MKNKIKITLIQDAFILYHSDQSHGHHWGLIGHCGHNSVLHHERMNVVTSTS